MTAAALSVVCAWLLLCALANLLPRSSLSRLRWFLPEWRLFAPNPPSRDYYLCARTRHQGRRPEPFETLLPSSWHRWTMVWNPGGRRRKMVQDLIGTLLDLAPREAEGSELPERVVRSEAYALLLGVSASGRPPGASVQFGIRAETESGGQLLLTSRWHRVPPSSRSSGVGSARLDTRFGRG